MSLITGRLDVVMRHEHRAGEKLSVDYAGQTVDLIDQQAGEIHGAQIFIAVMGASSCTFAEATLSQKVEDWIGCQSWFEEIDKPALKQLPSAPYELAYWTNRGQIRIYNRASSLSMTNFPVSSGIRLLPM